MPRPKNKTPDKSGFYSVSVTVGRGLDGKPIIKRFRSKKSYRAAQEKAEKYKKNEANSSVLFEEWANTWLWDYKYPQVKENTFEYTYRSIVENHLVPYFKGLRMCDISNSMIQTFFNLNKNWSKSMLNKMLICLRQIYDTAIANQLLTYNPCGCIKFKTVKKPKEKVVYTREEYEKVLKACENHRYGIYIRILLQLGLRISELCGLMWEDFDFTNSTVCIQRACTDLNGMAVIAAPKSQQSIRTIPVPSDLMEELKKSRKSGYIIVSPHHKNVTPPTFRAKRYDVFFSDTGVKRLNPHELRHTCGTLLYEQCHDIYAVQRFLGHSDIKVTSNIYVHDNVNELRAQLFGEI